MEKVIDAGKKEELSVTPGLAQEYITGEYGISSGSSYEVEIGENDVTAVDVLVAAHKDKYGDDFTDAGAEDYIGGFDYITAMFGLGYEVDPSYNGISFTVNGIQPYDSEGIHEGGTGYGINQYVVQPGDEICVYIYDFNNWEAPAVFSSFEERELEAKAMRWM